MKAKPKQCDANLRLCAVCGTGFYAYPSSNRHSCSDKCSTIVRGNSISKHGESGTRLYSIWNSMKGRCGGSNGNGKPSPYYQNVQVCDEWKVYVTFRSWALSNGYSDTLEIDRIDNDGNYCPENCRWATRSQQMQNTGKRQTQSTSKYKGVSRHSQNGTWVAQGSHGGVYTNIGSFKTELEAAIARDKWALCTVGEFANLNFKEAKHC